MTKERQKTTTTKLKPHRRKKKIPCTSCMVNTKTPNKNVQNIHKNKLSP
jgi:hypothetical protein